MAGNYKPIRPDEVIVRYRRLQRLVTTSEPLLAEYEQQMRSRFDSPSPASTQSFFEASRLLPLLRTRVEQIRALINRREYQGAWDLTEREIQVGGGISFVNALVFSKEEARFHTLKPLECASELDRVFRELDSELSRRSRQNRRAR